MTEIKCCGCLPDPIDHRHHADFERLGLAAGTEQWPSLRAFCGEVLNQQSTSSCVPHAILDAERTTLRARHLIDAPLGSILQLYYGARFRSGLHGSDDGCYPSVAIFELEANGIAPAFQWPFAPMHVQKRPPIAATRDAYERRGMRDTYAIHESTVDGRIAAMRAALNAKRAGTMQIPVDRAMMFSNGVTLIEYAKLGAIEGYHLVEFVALADDGGPCVEIKNSWGSGWRDGGYAYLDRGFIDNTQSLYIIDPKDPPR